MSSISFLVFAVLLAVIGTLIFGVVSMARNGQVGHRSSAQWMTARVVLQALALALIVMAVLTAT